MVVEASDHLGLLLPPPSSCDLIPLRLLLTHDLLLHHLWIHHLKPLTLPREQPRPLVLYGGDEPSPLIVLNDVAAAQPCLTVFDV